MTVDRISQDFESARMAIKCIGIDLTDLSVQLKFNFISSFPPSLMHDDIELIETTFNKYFYDSSRISGVQCHGIALLDFVPSSATDSKY
jgi:hypothetical protein